MSRQRKFTLKFKAGLTINIGIAKSFGEKVGCVQTKIHDGKNKQVRTVKVIPSEVDGDPVKPTSIELIDEVIGWTDVESSYRYKDEDGNEKLLSMDKKLIEKLFSKSEYMKVVGFMDSSSIAPNMYAGDHYFVKVAVGKSKEPEPADVKVYSLLYHILCTKGQHLLTTFVSGDREKYGVMYCVGDGLMFSTLIHSNYQREAPEVERCAVPKAEIHTEKMLKLFTVKRFDPTALPDRYEEQVGKYIESLKEHARTGKIRVVTRVKKVAVAEDDDFFGLLDAM
jgi:non-homologous end joining protein Ku